MRLATTSSMGVPRNTMRFFKSKEKMSRRAHPGWSARPPSARSRREDRARRFRADWIR